MNEDGRALVERARAGDADALERLVAELRGPVRAFFDRNVGAGLRRFLSLPDLEQELLMRVPDLLGRLPADADTAVVTRIVLHNARWVLGNAARSVNRVEGESVLADGLAPSAPAPSTAGGQVTRDDYAGWVRDLVQDLEEPQRAVVERRLRDDTFAAIAAELGISETAARKRFLQAAVTLRRLAEQDGGAPA